MVLGGLFSVFLKKNSCFPRSTSVQCSQFHLHAWLTEFARWFRYVQELRARTSPLILFDSMHCVKRTDSPAIHEWMCTYSRHEYWATLTVVYSCANAICRYVISDAYHMPETKKIIFEVTFTLIFVGRQCSSVVEHVCMHKAMDSIPRT